jgi:lactoylglutathione lyase
MRTLHIGLRVADLDRSLAFYTSVGYEVVGEVPDTDLGHLTMLKLPDDEFVAIELVHDPAGVVVDGTRLSHLVIQVDSMDATLTELGARGVAWRRPPLRTGRTTSGRHGSSTPTATGSSSSSGPSATPTA